MEVQSRYVLSALDCIRVGLLHYELRDKMVRRGRAAVQLSTATEHLVREKLRSLKHPDPDVRIPYGDLVGLLVPSRHVRPHEAKSLTRYRRMRNEVVHSAVHIERNQLSDFEGSTQEVLHFLQRFLTQELHIDPLDELDSCFAEVLRGEQLDFHDRADLRSKAAVDSVLMDHEVEEGVELANEGFDLAIRAVACGVGLPADSGTTDDVLSLMLEQGRNNEAWCSIRDEYTNLEPGDFQRYYNSFPDISEAEEYVRLVREVVIDLLNRARRPKWERPIRDYWPDVVALVGARSPGTAETIPENPADVTFTGTHVRLGSFLGNRDPDYHVQLVTAALRLAVPHLPRDFTVGFGPRVTRRTVYLSGGDDN